MYVVDRGEQKENTAYYVRYPNARKLVFVNVAIVEKLTIILVSTCIYCDID